MSTCNNVVRIEQSEFLANSLFKINNNYFNLDSGLCGLGEEVKQLQEFVKTLSAKDTPTVDLFFSPQQYYITGDVINRSIGTIKLGQDIPQTTKVFLTGARLNRLTDAIIVNPRNENVVRWSGTEWINTPLIDEIGARWLYELKDVKIDNTLTDRHILKYNSLSGFWFNTQETGLSAIPNGNYEDVVISGTGFNQGLEWSIVSGRIGNLELATNSVNTSAFRTLQVTNDKIANNTIGLEKCAFTLGEVNTASNIGLGTGIFKQKSDTTFQFRNLRGDGGCQITSFNDKIVIFANQPPEPLPPTGSNIDGSGAQILKNITSDNKFQFKTFTQGSGIAITDDGNEITISRPITRLGLTMLNSNPAGEPLSQTEIINTLSNIYPPSNFAENTICIIQFDNISISSLNNFTFSIPLEIKYRYLRSCTTSGGIAGGTQPTTTTCSLRIEIVDPVGDWVAPSKGAPLVTVTGTKNMRQTVFIPSTSTPALSLTKNYSTYKITNSAWQAA